MKTLLERELERNGMTIRNKEKGALRLSELIQEILLDAPVERLQYLHDVYGDEFICNDGKIKVVVTD